MSFHAIPDCVLCQGYSAVSFLPFCICSYSSYNEEDNPFSFTPRSQEKPPKPKRQALSQKAGKGIKDKVQAVKRGSGKFVGEPESVYEAVEGGSHEAVEEGSHEGAEGGSCERVVQGSSSQDAAEDRSHQEITSTTQQHDSHRDSLKDEALVVEVCYKF